MHLYLAGTSDNKWWSMDSEATTYIWVRLRHADRRNCVILWSSIVRRIETAFNERKKPCVFFLDDFPTPKYRVKTSNEACLRFMRNVFRAYGIPVITSSTHGTARDLITASQSSRVIDGFSFWWCVVWPDLPRYHLSEDIFAPPELFWIVNNSRPWFTQEAVKYFTTHHFDPSRMVSTWIIWWVN